MNKLIPLLVFSFFTCFLSGQFVITTAHPSGGSGNHLGNFDCYSVSNNGTVGFVFNILSCNEIDESHFSIYDNDRLLLLTSELPQGNPNPVEREDCPDGQAYEYELFITIDVSSYCDNPNGTPTLDLNFQLNGGVFQSPKDSNTEAVPFSIRICCGTIPTGGSTGNDDAPRTNPINGRSSQIQQIKFSPNPFDQNILIENVEEGDIVILRDMLGRILTQETVRTPKSAQRHQINTDGLPVGTFVLSVLRDNEIEKIEKVSKF